MVQILERLKEELAIGSRRWRLRAKYHCTHLDMSRHLAIVVGAEGEGLRRLVKKNSDFLVKIPMAGRVSSLNVAVATGIVLFELNRRRDAKIEPVQAHRVNRRELPNMAEVSMTI